MYWLAVLVMFVVVVVVLCLILFVIGLSQVAMDELCEWYGNDTPKYAAGILMILGFAAYLTFATIRDVDRENAAKGVPSAQARLSR